MVGGLKILKSPDSMGLWSLPGRRATFFAGCLLVQPEVQFELKFSRLVGAMFGAIRKRTPPDSAPHSAHLADWNFLISQEGGAGPPDPSKNAESLSTLFDLCMKAKEALK